MEEKCIFCKIVAGEMPSTKIYEDNDFLAILDAYPNTKGQTLIIPKKHITSDIFDADFDYVHKALDIAKKVAEQLKQKLGPDRVALVSEGVFIEHMHLKLYPLYNTAKNADADYEPVYFDEFPGFLTTKMGPRVSPEVLEGLVESLRSEYKI